MAIPFDQLPFRLKVLVRLTELLQTIERAMPDAPANYSWSLAPDADFPDGRVLRGRVAYGDDDPLPMLAIVEDPKQLDRDAIPDRETASPGDWDLLIQGFVKDDPVHPTDPAYFLAADVSAKLAETSSDPRNILGLGYKKPCVDKLHIGAPVIRPPDAAISATTYFWLPVRLHLVEDTATAFT